MKKIGKNRLVLFAVTLIAGGLVGWLIKPDSPRLVDESTHQMEPSDHGTWTCSMHPQIRRSEPGDCPICGMDLIPLESYEGETNAMTVNMSPTAMQLANVSTAVVGKMDPVKSVQLNGKVQEDERLVFTQSSHIPGRIEELRVNFTGDFVSKGQTIALIYSPELVTAQEELFEAQKISKIQPQLFTSAKEKLKNWKLTDQQIEQILQSGSPGERFPVRADVSGYVTKKIVNVGDYVARGQGIYQLANLSRVWILFDVYESDMPWVKKGDLVSYTVQSLPGKTFEGTISYIDPVIDPETRVAKARVEENNRDLDLKPEMFVSGTIKARLPQKSNSIVIPKSAVMWTGERSVVYIKSPSSSNTLFLMREVTLGPALGDGYIVESGLQPGEEIAVNGTFSIDAAAQLAGKPSMMNREGGPAMTGHQHGETPADNPERSVHIQNQPSTDTGLFLQPLIGEYLAMKDALVEDDMEEAKEAAGRFRKELSQIGGSEVTGKAHDTWRNYSGEMKEALEHLGHIQSIEELREVFQMLSEIMIDLSGSFKPLDEPLYVQHCPMADNNRGANWLSLSEEIRNPYFGESMLTCGEVTETIRKP